MAKTKMTPERQDRLKAAVETSFRALKPYRETVLRLNEEYAGPMYGLRGVGAVARPKDKYVNLLKQAVSAYMTLLASSRPRVLMSTHRLELKAFAKHYQTGVNRLLEEICLEKTTSQWVRDAFFWLGIVKVHMADSGEQVAEGDLLMDPGMPFASNIALDDYFFDMNARRWSEVRYEGDIYQLPMDELKNSGIYKGEALEDLQEANPHVTEDKLADMQAGRETAHHTLDPMVDVCDIWIPRDKTIYTYIVSQRADTLQLKGNPILEVEWPGTELGPYKKLHFDEVSENCMPCSTAADLHPLDKLVNNLYRKNAAKAQRLKEVNTYTPAGADAARKAKMAGDGDLVEVRDTKDLAKLVMGGVDSGLHGFMLNSMELFDRMAGNLQAMLGLGASTGTVGQEKIVSGAASRREGQLQNAVLTATTDLVSELAFLLWQDQFTELPSRTEVQGLPGISYDSTWKPDLREGEWKDYQIEIDVFSMAYQGPGARVEAVNGLLGQLYIPLMPMIQQQGGTIDLAKLAEMHSEMLNLPQLRDIILFNQPPVAPQAGAEGPRKPPISNRNYTRTNVSAGDNSGVPKADWAEQQQPQT